MSFSAFLNHAFTTSSLSPFIEHPPLMGSRINDCADNILETLELIRSLHDNILWNAQVLEYPPQGHSPFVRPFLCLHNHHQVDITVRRRLPVSIRAEKNYFLRIKLIYNLSYSLF